MKDTQKNACYLEKGKSQKAYIKERMNVLGKVRIPKGPECRDIGQYLRSTIRHELRSYVSFRKNIYKHAGFWEMALTQASKRFI